MKKLIFVILFFSFLRASFEEPLEGVDSKGMGGINTSLISVSAVNNNPSISPFINSLKIGISSAVSVNSDEGQVLGITSYSSIPLIKRKLGMNIGIDYNGLHGIDYPGLNNIAYYEMRIITGIGYRFNKLALGMSAKYQMWHLGIGTIGSKGDNFNLTCGLLLYKLADLFTIGIAADNLFGGSSDSGETGFSEKMPTYITAGILFGLSRIETGVETKYNITDNLSDVGVGLRYSFLNNGALKLSTGCLFIGNFESVIPTFGLKYLFRKMLSIQYAFKYPFSFMGSSGEHYLGIVYHFN